MRQARRAKPRQIKELVSFPRRYSRPASRPDRLILILIVPSSSSINVTVPPSCCVDVKKRLKDFSFPVSFGGSGSGFSSLFSQAVIKTSDISINKNADLRDNWFSILFIFHMVNKTLRKITL